MKHLALLAFVISIAACVAPASDDPVDLDVEESSATAPPARRLGKTHAWKCNAEKLGTWFERGYSDNPLCVPPSATGTCGAAEQTALEKRLAGYVKCPGCEAGEKGCEPRAELFKAADIQLKGGNCCLINDPYDGSDRPPSRGFYTWCTTCVGANCVSQAADTGICLDDSDDADRPEPTVSSFPDD